MKTKRILFAVLLVSLTACEHKELCYDHPHAGNLQVILDWQLAPDATPASMAFYLFPDGEEGSLLYELTDRSGGAVRATQGHYRALCLNSDSRLLVSRNTGSWETFEITSSTTPLLPGLATLGVRSEGAPTAPDARNERVAAAVDGLWCDRIETSFPVTMEGDTVILYPASLLCNYSVEIRGAQNLSGVIGVSASLSGMAGGLFAGTGRLSGEAVTVPFEMEADEDQGVLMAAFKVFGHCPLSVQSHTLIVYAVLSDGSKWYYLYDVTDQVHTAPDPCNVHILLEGLPLPQPSQGGGFTPSVGEWEEVQIDVAM